MAEVDIKYEPRPQFMGFHDRNNRWACMVAHRRAGKTVACVNELIARATYTQKKNARYGYISPYFSQTKEIAWMYLKEYAAPLASRISESELSITLRHNGAKIQLYGADNPDKLRGVYFDGVVLDEYGDMRPSVWSTVILPTLTDRRGWAVFIGTPKGKNHFYKIWRRSQGKDLREDEDPEEVKKAWFSYMLRASESGILSEEDLSAARAEQTEYEYAQEFECSFDAAILGTYYAGIIHLIEGRGQITDKVDYDPAFPVKVATDLGYTDSFSLWFWQERPDGLAIIDYEQADSQPLSYYFNLLRYKPYLYDQIWLPHDARAKSLQTGRSTVEQFLQEDFPTFPGSENIIRVAPSLKLQHGIDAVRLLLPSCHFNSRCEEGIEGLRHYRRRWDETKKVFSNEPVHDWASHPSDAFRYLALVASERIVRPESLNEQIEKKVTQGGLLRLDDLFAERERRQRRVRV